jgi:choline-sulfatase
VAFVDHHVGRVIDAVAKGPLAQRTAIIVTSDHGEAFGEHGMIRHGFELWEELVRVPLMVRVPGLSSRRIVARRSAIDLVPTVLDLLGVEPPSGQGGDFLSGKSLLADLISPEGHTPEERPIYIDMPAGPHNADRQGFIDGDLKLVLQGARPLSLFDLKADPGEKKDLLDQSALAQPLLARFKAFRSTLRPVRVDPK